MNDSMFQFLPRNLKDIEKDTEKSGFSMPSERKTGALLRTLVASKPGGHFLELGTGTGLGTAWLHSGMNQSSLLDTVDSDLTVQEIARRHLGSETSVIFHHCDGEEFIHKAEPRTFDLIFADTWPGKFYLLEETLSLLNIGGLYVIDDMNPKPDWSDKHAAKMDQLLSTLHTTSQLSVCRLEWATGIVICTRIK